MVYISATTMVPRRSLELKECVLANVDQAAVVIHATARWSSPKLRGHSWWWGYQLKGGACICLLCYVLLYICK